MKKNINFIVPFLFVFLLYECNSNIPYDDALSNKIETFLNRDISNYESVVVIPGAGCSGCITNAEFFFRKTLQMIELNLFLRTLFRKKICF
jgi:hypothetical protein